MELEYTITENISRNHAGQIIQIDFQFEETTTVEGLSSASSGTVRRHNREKRTRIYDTSVTRDQYQNLARRLKNPLTFDEFVSILRPFIMGFYAANELERGIGRDIICNYI
jgi:hypothetical protein